MLETIYTRALQDVTLRNHNRSCIKRYATIRIVQFIPLLSLPDIEHKIFHTEHKILHTETELGQHTDENGIKQLYHGLPVCTRR